MTIYRSNKNEMITQITIRLVDLEYIMRGCDATPQNWSQFFSEIIEASVSVEVLDSLPLDEKEESPPLLDNVAKEIMDKW